MRVRGCQTNRERVPCQFRRDGALFLRVGNCNRAGAHLYSEPGPWPQSRGYRAVNKIILRVNVRPTSRDKRPVNLDLGTIQLHVTAYASITHRVTGVAMFFASFLMLWALDQSLASEASFLALTETLTSPLAKVILWGTASFLSYHALAGLKHLVMDAGIGETMRGGVIGARAVFALAAIAAVWWGVALW